MVHLHDIVEVLHKYQGRCGCLDVRASDVAELNDATAGEHFEPMGDDVVEVDGGAVVGLVCVQDFDVGQPGFAPTAVTCNLGVLLQAGEPLAEQEERTSGTTGTGHAPGQCPVRVLPIFRVEQKIGLSLHVSRRGEVSINSTRFDWCRTTNTAVRGSLFQRGET